MKKLTKIASIILMASMMLTACSSAPKKNITSTVNEVQPGGINYDEALGTDFNEDEFYEAYINYCFNLAAGCEADSNMLVSPASVMLALNMTAAGANNNTLDEMTAVFNPNATNDQMQAFASEYMSRLNNAEGIELNVANSIWGRENILRDTINNAYLDFTAEAYSAEFNLCPFDNSTVNDINSWVDDNTNGMIPQIIDEINPDTVLFLINAIAFEGQWAEEYEDYQVRDANFTGIAGVQEVPFLHGTEETYFESDLATGFLKYYEGEEYYFLAILPKDETADANEFLRDFTGDDYMEFIGSRTTAYDVVTMMPEFTFDYDTTLVDTMKNLGMNEAFSPAADFGNIANLRDPLYISDIIHSTHIELDRSGTRAAAATVVMMDNECCVEPEPTKIVELNRPFVFAIVDAESDTPLFIGTVNEI